MPSPAQGDEVKPFAPSIQIEDPAWRAADEGFALMPGEQRTVALTATASGAAKPAGLLFSGLGKDVASY